MWYTVHSSPLVTQYILQTQLWFHIDLTCIPISIELHTHTHKHSLSLSLSCISWISSILAINSLVIHTRGGRLFLAREREREAERQRLSVHTCKTRLGVQCYITSKCDPPTCTCIGLSVYYTHINYS